MQKKNQTRIIALRVTPELEKKIRAGAKRQGLAVSQFVRLAVICMLTSENASTQNHGSARNKYID